MNRGELIKVFADSHSREETAELVQRLIGYDGAFLNDYKWITVNGTHVRLNKNGEPETGPKRLRKALKGKAGTEEREAKVGFPKDVTNEYKKTSKPGSGKVIKGPGYKEGDSKKGKMERETAEWLVKTFGGDVVMNKQTSSNGEQGKNPEYTWRGKLWELKEPEKKTENAIGSCLRAGLHQIKANPGGVLIDITKCGAGFDMATRAITYRAKRSAHFDVDVIIIKRGDRYKVLRFNTEKETDQE